MMRDVMDASVEHCGGVGVESSSQKPSGANPQQNPPGYGGGEAGSRRKARKKLGR